MNLLLHTIALEPARWTPARVDRPLVELLPAMEAAGFGLLEVYEPHLTTAADEDALAGSFARHGLTPVVLGSYLDLSPDAQPDKSFSKLAEELAARVDRFAFRKVRLFPGRSADPTQDSETLRRVADRLRHLAEKRPAVQFLVETHDHSLADQPENMVRLVELCGRDNVGLIYQPTRFEPDAARAQFELQKPFTRHFHLQNRAADGSFALLGEGVIPWRKFLRGTGSAVDATLEFVPRGVCAPAAFDLAATLEEARAETQWLAASSCR